MMDFILSRDSEIFLLSSTTSGTTRLAASVGVEALRSATSSMIGLSFSCPIADMTGVSVNTTLGRMRYAMANMRKLIEKNKIYLPA